MSATIGAVLSAKAATISELRTMGLRDLYLLLEVLLVDAHNQQVLAKRARAKS